MDELRIMDRPALTIVGKRTEARLSSIGAVIGRSFGEAFGALGSQAGGAPFVIYETAPEGDRPFAIEVCVPLASPAEVVPPEGWEVRVLPAGRFATRIHVGPYGTIGRTYEAMAAAIPAAGHAIAGPPREVYLSPPSTPAAEIRTIVEFPVVRVPSAVPA